MAPRWFRWVPPALLAAGATLIALAIYQGTAQVSLIVIIPVITGTSAFFLTGVLLIAAGFALLPIALGFGMALDQAGESTGPPVAAVSAELETETAAGGVILIGPLPILFGKWGNATPWTYLTLALIGLALTLLAVFLVLFV